MLALFACAAVAAVSANVAQANWTVGEEGNVLKGSAAVEVSGGPWTLESTLLGEPITLEAESLMCAEGVECTIDNEIGTNHSRGWLVFTGVTVVGLPCTVHSPGQANGTVKTEELTDELIMDPSNPAGPVFDKFFPQTGTTFVQIEFTGETCPLAGVVAPVKGTATGQASNATGVLVVNQSLTFGAAQQTTGGGSLTLGKNAATLTGVANNRLIGAYEGLAFGADE